VLGIVGWYFGKRFGVKWSAGLGATERGSVKTAAGRDFASRRAAVGWIAAEIAKPEFPKSD
jgi:hypothetical protein